MQYTVSGILPIDFEADGRRIVGTNLFVVYDSDNPALDGQMTDKLFIREGISIPANLSAGDTVEISFNRKGKVEKIALT
jgi:hypothetical protein